MGPARSRCATLLVWRGHRWLSYPDSYLLDPRGATLRPPTLPPSLPPSLLRVSLSSQPNSPRHSRRVLAAQTLGDLQSSPCEVARHPPALGVMMARMSALHTRARAKPLPWDSLLVLQPITFLLFLLAAHSDLSANVVPGSVLPFVTPARASAQVSLARPLSVIGDPKVTPPHFQAPIAGFRATCTQLWKRPHPHPCAPRSAVRCGAARQVRFYLRGLGPRAPTDG